MSWTRRIIAAVAALIGAALLTLLIAIVAVVVFGVSIDASRWRDAIAVRVSAALGRPVALDGPLELELGRETALHVGGIRILNPPGFATPELAALGKARARIDLFAALRGEWRVHSFEAADGHLRLERTAGGRVNWAPSTSTRATSQRQGAGLAAVEIERVSIRNFAFEYHDIRADTHHSLQLDELSGVGKWSEPLKLTLHGHVANSFPYSIDIEGGSAQLLQEAREAWPFALDFAFLGTRLHASGTVEAGHAAARFDFGAGTEDLQQVARFLQTKLPDFGAAALSGTIHLSTSAIEVGDLHGVLGATEFAGGLVLSLVGARQRLSGELRIATLDVRPFFEGTRDRSDKRVTYDELTQQTLALRRTFLPFDADLVVQIRSSFGLPVEVRNARIALHIDERGLRAPIEGTIADVPLTGRIDLDTAAATPIFALQLDARNLPLSSLAQSIANGSTVDGKLGSVAVRLGGRGETLGALVASLDLRVTVAAARLHYMSASGHRPVEVTLDAAEFSALRGQPVRCTARGTVLGKRTTLKLRAGVLQQIVREAATPIELELAAAGATAHVQGFLALPGTARASDLAFQLQARRAGDLSRWLGFAPESNLPVALGARLHVDNEWRLQDTTVTLGRTELTVDAHRAHDMGEPILVAAVRSPLIDVPELRTLRPKSAGASPPSLEAWLDMPILPQGIHLAAADVGFGLERVVLGRTEFADVGFSAHIRNGQLMRSPFAARFAGVPFQGSAALDLRGKVPEASLWMSTGSVDVGMLLRTLGVAEDIDGRAGALQVELLGRGSDLRELLQHSSFKARLQDGNIALRGPARRVVTEIHLEQALIAAMPGKPITVHLQGMLDTIPAELSVSTGTLDDFVRDASRVPLSVEARAAGAKLNLEGMVELPLGRGGALTMALAGEQLDSLRELTRAELPPWGPWSLEGPINLTPTGYEVKQLTVRSGQSRLYGRGRVDLSGAHPRVELYLRAPHIQLDDFPFRNQAQARGPATARAMRATASRTATQTQELLSSAFLRRFDANVDVAVEHVQSGNDRLGDGVLRAQIVDGRFDIDSAEINIPGGSAQLSGSFDPNGPGVALAANVRVEHFDYGILARRLRPGTDLTGVISLRLNLTGQAPALSSILAHADGNIDVAVWPNNMRAGVINRWAVNIFFALLPIIDPGPDAHVNCVVARLNLKGGELTPDALLIDTTRVRVVGTGSANFATEELAFRFRPRAKGPVLLSLQPPIDVTGTMTNYRVGVPVSSIPSTLARFFTSVFVVPIQMLTQGRLPADGSDVCTDPLR
jgi:AsmA family protein